MLIRVCYTEVRKKFIHQIITDDSLVVIHKATDRLAETDGGGARKYIQCWWQTWPLTRTDRTKHYSCDGSLKVVNKKVLENWISLYSFWRTRKQQTEQHCEVFPAFSNTYLNCHNFLRFKNLFYRYFNFQFKTITLARPTVRYMYLCFWKLECIWLHLTSSLSTGQRQPKS